MARHPFGATRSDWVMVTGEAVTEDDVVTGYLPVMLPGQEVTLWDARTGGSPVTDITDPSTGDPIATLSADADGNIPVFNGPDGVRKLWGSASSDGSATRYAMIATDLGDDIADLDTRVTTLESGGVGAQVPETVRFSSATVTVAEATSPPPPHRAYNISGADQTVQSVHASVDTAPTTNAMEFDVLVDGTSVFAASGDRPSIPVGANASGTVSPTTSATFASGSYLTVVPTVGDDAAEAVTVSVRVV